MEARLDSEWLLGEAKWWPSTAGKKAVRAHGVFGAVLEEAIPSEPVPDLRIDEVNPPTAWQHTTPRIGGNGWIRQRLKHPATLLLFPFAWSAFFLLTTIIPLLFPGRTFDDQTAAAVMFSIAWALLLIPLYMVRSKQPTAQRYPNTIRLHPFDLTTFSTAILFFLLHIIIDVRLGWISYALFWIAWSRTVASTGRTFESGAVRWLLPVDVLGWSTSTELCAGWTAECEGWRNGPLAHLDAEFSRGWSARLFGVNRSGHHFLALVMLDRNGFLFDPFAARLITNPALIESFGKPPVSTRGLAWPERFLQLVEEE